MKMKDTGYNLFLKGRAEDEEKEFAAAISEKQQRKLLFHIGDVISGTGWTKKYPEIECADYYRAGSLKKLSSGEVINSEKAPWLSPVADLSTYDWLDYL